MILPIEQNFLFRGSVWNSSLTMYLFAFHQKQRKLESLSTTYPRQFL